MSVNVRYKIPFSSESAARSALEQMGAFEEFDDFTQSNRYVIDNGTVQLQANLSGADKSLIVIKSYCGYVSPGSFTDGVTYGWFPSNALDISNELEYLTGLDAFKGKTIHYGSDLDEAETLGEPVTPEFLDGLDSFASRSCDCC